MSKSIEFSQTVKGIVTALILSLILTLLLSLVYFFTSFQENIIHSLFVSGLSVLIASFYISYQSGSRGLINGLLIGAGFFIISVIIFYIFYIDNPSWLILLEKLSVSLIAGIIGGIVGVIVRR